MTRENLHIDIGVCTFRRPELADTLRSLAAMTVPERATVRVIVADNDDAPSARALIERLRAEMPFEIIYVHCPASNISIARNACLDNGMGDFLAFIDDDETASKECSVSWKQRARPAPRRFSVRSEHIMPLRLRPGCSAAISTRHYRSG